MSCRFFARYAIIAGYLRMTLQMPSALESYTLENVKIMLLQNVRLEHMLEPDITEEIPTHSVLLWQLPETRDAGGAYRGMSVHRGQGLAITQVCRLPNEVVIRQTTSEHSNTGIRCSHKLSLIVHYRSESGGTSLKELCVRFPVTISSCDSSIWNTQVWQTKDLTGVPDEFLIQRSLDTKKARPSIQPSLLISGSLTACASSRTT